MSLRDFLCHLNIFRHRRHSCDLKGISKIWVINPYLRPHHHGMIRLIIPLWLNESYCLVNILILKGISCSLAKVNTCVNEDLVIVEIAENS